MGRALPFSEIDSYLKSNATEKTGCIVDTQILAASVYEPHVFYEDTEFIIGKLQEHKIGIYATVTTRSEFIEFMRRMIITEKIMGMVKDDSPWRLTNDAKKKIKSLKVLIDREAAIERLPLLKDHHIKELKGLFFPRARSGKDGWIELCKEFLEGALTAAWNAIVDDLGVNYIDLSEGQAPQIIKEKVTWEAMCHVSEKTCLGTSDAMIVNMLQCSTLPFIVSADYDVAYAVLAEETEKTVFVPDRLFRNRIKFWK